MVSHRTMAFHPSYLSKGSDTKSFPSFLIHSSFGFFPDSQFQTMVFYVFNRELSVLVKFQCFFFLTITPTVEI